MLSLRIAPRIAFAALLALAAQSPAQDTNYALRVACDFQQPESGLLDLRLLQGSAPILQFAPVSGVRPIEADSLTTVRFVMSQTATGTYFVATNAYLATNRAYWVQVGTIGTNSCPTNSTTPDPWFYTVTYERNGGIYWAGNGRAYIEAASFNGTNGITWQEWAAGAAKDDLARQWIGDLSNVVENIEVGEVAYGITNGSAYRGDWGNSVSGKVNSALGAAGSNSASIVAVGAVASNAVPASATNGWEVGSHAGLASVNATNGTDGLALYGGAVGIGTATPFRLFPVSYPPTATPTVGVHVVNSGILLESKARTIGAGSTSAPAFMAMGWDLREWGRAGLWLNSYVFSGDGTNYDNSSDIYFGQGTNMTDSGIRWTISSRPVLARSWGHHVEGQLAIFESDGAGSSQVGGQRFAIFPDTNQISGPIFMGTDTRFPAPRPDADVTLQILDNTKSPFVVVEGATNAATTSRPRLEMRAAGKSATMTFAATNQRVDFALDGTNAMSMTTTGGVWVGSLALGTNAAVSNWPSASGIDASTATGIAQTVVAVGSFPAALAEPVDGTVTLSATSKVWLVRQGAAVLTNLALIGITTDEYTQISFTLERGTNEFAFGGVRTNVATPAASTTNMYFGWRGRGAASNDWNLN